MLSLVVVANQFAAEADSQGEQPLSVFADEWQRKAHGPRRQLPWFGSPKHATSRVFLELPKRRFCRFVRIEIENTDRRESNCRSILLRGASMRIGEDAGAC